jgi:hypothetical protein
LFDLAHVVVVERPGVAFDIAQAPDLHAQWDRRRSDDPRALREAPAGAIVMQPVTAHDISATTIRAELGRGAAGSRPYEVCFRRRFWPILSATTFIDSPVPRKISRIAVTALEDIKARDITVFDVRKLTSLYDTLIIATAESNGR